MHMLTLLFFRIFQEDTSKVDSCKYQLKKIQRFQLQHRENFQIMQKNVKAALESLLAGIRKMADKYWKFVPIFKMLSNNLNLFRFSKFSKKSEIPQIFGKFWKISLG